MFTLKGQENVWCILTVKSVVNSSSWKKNVSSTFLLPWSLLDSSNQHLYPSVLRKEGRNKERRKEGKQAIQLSSLKKIVVKFLEFTCDLCIGFYTNFLLVQGLNWSLEMELFFHYFRFLDHTETKTRSEWNEIYLGLCLEVCRNRAYPVPLQSSFTSSWIHYDIAVVKGLLTRANTENKLLPLMFPDLVKFH